jgi:hypothetical protein
MTRVIKETSFHSYRWMNDFSYHLKSLKVHSNVPLNARRRFVFQETPHFNKDRSPDHLLQIRAKHMATKNPNSFVKTNLIGR